MPDIHIQRPHQLGLPAARQIATRWSDKAQARFGLDCHYTRGDTHDTLAFHRAGVSGTLQVCADQFVFDAALGFLFGAFKERIEAEIGAQLDALLAPDASALPPSA